MSSSILQDLNEAQRAAVEHEDGPLLIVAGAGTGKTRVITRRVARLIERGVPEGRILAITFTNKAAREMAERVQALVPGSSAWVSTFHALGARVLRTDGPAVGVPRDFTILDRDGQLSLMRRLLKDMGVDVKQVRPEAVLSLVSIWKNEGLTPEDRAAGPLHGFEQVALDAYRLYEKELDTQRQVDFDDLLLLPFDLFRDPEAGARWGRRFLHVLIDEYQDTNRLQSEIAAALAGHGHLTACGDPDQSIYSWRGADVTNILTFQARLPGSTLIRLEENYRSTGSILAVASALISHNVQRVERDLFTRGGAGPRPELLRCLGDGDEAERVARRIRELRASGTGREPEVAVLYRTNALSRSFERVLGSHGIAYRVVGSVEFFARKEVKDLLSFLRLKVNPHDAESFLRALKVPARGIGEKSAARILEHAAGRGASAVDALLDPACRERLRGSARLGADELAKLLSWLIEPGPRRIADLLEELRVRLGYEDHLESVFGPAEAAERMENVKALVADAYEYEMSAPDRDLRAYLEERALVQDTDEIGRAARESTVSLMTLHSAKGLEFDVVFLAGLEENLLPHRRALGEGAEHSLEEERRLLYVGVTRARSRLFLSYCSQRAQYGRFEPTLPSRFLGELPPDLLAPDGEEEYGSVGPAARDEGDPCLVLDADQDGGFEPGELVRHEVFGVGEVLEVGASPRHPRLRVRFQSGLVKTIQPDYSRLRRVRQHEH